MKIVISDRKTHDISPELIGVFFEDINYGADGGIYAEMIENRSFEFLEAFGDKADYYTVYDGGYGWRAYPDDKAADLKFVMGSPVSEENPHYLRLTAAEGSGFANKAYSGLTLKAGENYRVSFYARAVSFCGDINVSAVKNQKTYFSGKVSMVKEDVIHTWHKYELTVTAEESVKGAEFVITLGAKGTAEFDFVSMFPENAEAGIFRKDSFEMLKKLHPAFMRFPGGCIVEGNTMSNRYRFKDSLKRPEDRKNNWNRWAVHNNCEENGYHSVFSHYNQTLGLGYYEYFLLCELIGAKPLPVMNVGMACQYQSYEFMSIDSPEFEQMVQDAVDLIEFANGGTDTVWGAVRAELGHPEPFGLDIMGIGNEQWQMDNTDFFTRYSIFEKRIHAQYPQMRLVGSAGPDVTSQHYTDAWEFYRREQEKNPNFVYAIDEHYYMKPEWFLENNDFYDNYSRSIKVFAGEYAAHPEEIKTVGPEKNTLRGAVSEAAYLTGIERNSDVVVLSSYAPLFARVGYTQWAPDLIWMDEETTCGSPSYYVQKMFADYTGNALLDTMGQEKTLRDKGIFISVSADENNNRKILKIVNTTDEPVEFSLETEAGDRLCAEKMVTLGGSEHNAYNTPENPERIVPSEMIIESDSFEVPGCTFTAVVIK